jgi:hypothetical protein
MMSSWTESRRQNVPANERICLLGVYASGSVGKMRARRSALGLKPKPTTTIPTAHFSSVDVKTKRTSRVEKLPFALQNGICLKRPLDLN